MMVPESRDTHPGSVRKCLIEGPIPPLSACFTALGNTHAGHGARLLRSVPMRQHSVGELPHRQHPFCAPKNASESCYPCCDKPLPKDHGADLVEDGNDAIVGYYPS